MCPIHCQMCYLVLGVSYGLIRSALWRSDTGASNEGSNLQQIWPDNLGPTWRLLRSPWCSRIFMSNLLAQIRDSKAPWRSQKPPCRPQSFGKKSFTHHWMRQGQGFPAHVELISYDTPARHITRNREYFFFLQPSKSRNKWYWIPEKMWLPHVQPQITLRMKMIWPK